MEALRGVERPGGDAGAHSSAATPAWATCCGCPAIAPTRASPGSRRTSRSATRRAAPSVERMVVPGVDRRGVPPGAILLVPRDLAKLDSPLGWRVSSVQRRKQEARHTLIAALGQWTPLSPCARDARPRHNPPPPRAPARRGPRQPLRQTTAGSRPVPGCAAETAPPGCRGCPPGSWATGRSG